MKWLHNTCRYFVESFLPHSAYFSFSFPLRRQTCEAFKSEKSPAANVTSRILNRVMELFPNLVLTPYFLRVKVPFIILGWDMLWAWLQVLFHVLNTIVIMTSSSMNLQRDFQWILSSLQRNVNLDFWVQNLSQFSFPPWERCNVENWCSVKILWQFWPRETTTLMADDRTQNVCCSTILFLFFWAMPVSSYIIQHIPGAINCSCFISCFHLFKSIFPAIWALLIFIIDWCRYASEIFKSKVRKVP